MTRQKPFTVADYLLTRLRQLNVSEVFQIPGDYVKLFTQTLEHFEGVTAVGAANELDAAYAADAYARTRGLGAVSLQYGVSTFSALNAIAGAYVERSPVVVISATPGRQERRIAGMYDVLYHHSTGNFGTDKEVFGHVTVGAEVLSSSADAPQVIDGLLTAALTHRRPVYIACYREVWGESCPPPGNEPLKPVVRKGDPAVLQNVVSEAWQQISGADNPIILAGIEVLRCGLSPLLQELIEASGFAYTTTTLGKTVLTETRQAFIGTYSDAASVQTVKDRVENAGCILALGTIITDDYLVLVEKKYSSMILAADDKVRAGYFIYDDIPLRDFMEALLEHFRSASGYPVKGASPVWPHYPEPWLSNSDPHWNPRPAVITYNRFFQHLTHFLGQHNLFPEVVLTLGVSSSLYVASNIYGMWQNSFLASAAWQCIGFETGAVSGAQLGSGKRALSIAGDGGFMMVCQALSTLARYKLNAVLFVMSNGVYAIEQVYVDITAFKPGSEHRFDTFDILPEWDYSALATAYGAEAYIVRTVSELDTALEAVRTLTDRPALVQVVIPQKDLPGQMKRLGTEGFIYKHKRAER